MTTVRCRSWIQRCAMVARGSAAALTHGITAASVALIVCSLALPFTHEYAADTIIGDLTPRQAWWAAGAMVLLTAGLLGVAAGCVGAVSALATRARARPVVALTLMLVLGVQVPWSPLLRIGGDLYEGRAAQRRHLQRLLPAGPHRGSPLSRVQSIVWPVSSRAHITSDFGWRHHPILGRPQFHNGVDVAVGHGTQIRSAAAGKVTRAKYDSLNGYHVVVRHSDGLRTAYCHLSAMQVQAGQRVFAGEVVGLSGASGRASGPHLHFGAWVRGRAVDPMRLVRR